LRLVQTNQFPRQDSDLSVTAVKYIGATSSQRLYTSNICAAYSSIKSVIFFNLRWLVKMKRLTYNSYILHSLYLVAIYKYAHNFSVR